MAKAKPRARARLKPWRARFEALRPTRAWLDPWVLGTLGLLLLGELETIVWLGALVAELRLQLACLTLVASAWAALRGHVARALALMACASLWWLPLWPYLRERRLTPQHGPTFSVVQQDLAGTRVDAAQLSRWLSLNAPDVLSLTNVDSRDTGALEKTAHGYKRLRSGHAAQGLLLARAMLVPHPQSAQSRGAGGALHVGRCSVEVVQLELPSLFDPTLLARRKKDIAALEHEAPAARRLYVGALGSRSSAPDLAPWTAAQGLRDARLGHGVLATAPAPLGVLGLALDHILLRGWVLVREASTAAPFAAGLHRPLSATLELTEPRCAPAR